MCEKESAEAFYTRAVLPITSEDLVEMEQVCWPHMTLSQSRELASMLRSGFTVAADSKNGTLPPARYVLV